MQVWRLAKALIVALVMAILTVFAATLIFSVNTGILGFFSAWVAFSCLFYRYAKPRMVIGSVALAFGIVCLLVVLMPIVLGVRTEGPASLLGAWERTRILFAIVFGFPGIALVVLGLWLIRRG